MSFWDDFIEKELSRVISENKAMSAQITLSTKREEIYRKALECIFITYTSDIEMRSIARAALNEGKEVK